MLNDRVKKDDQAERTTDYSSYSGSHWERRINLLLRRTQRLHQQIARPEREETRLDDYVLELRQWIKDRFKTPRRKWQEPRVTVSGLSHNDEGIAYLDFELSFFVDDIKLENGKRGDRISSQIYQEVVRYLKQSEAPALDKELLGEGLLDEDLLDEDRRSDSMTAA